MLPPRGTGVSAVRPRASYGPPNRNVMLQNFPEERFWKSHWPFHISTGIGALLLLFSLVLIALDIAVLSTRTITIGIFTVTLEGIYSSAVGLWGGVLLVIIAIFILVTNCSTFVSRLLSGAFVGAIFGAVISLIIFSVNAARVKDAVDVQGFIPFSEITVAKLSAAQVAFGVVTFLLCLAFVALFLYFVFRTRRARRGLRPRPQPPPTRYGF